MARRAGALMIVATMSLAAASLCQAHHSGAMFDHTQLVKYQGTVKSWQWINPHSWLTLVVPAANSDVQEIKFEIGSPSTLFRSGWRVDSFKPGDVVRIYAYPRKDGASGGMMVTATTAEGQELQWLPAEQTRDAKVIN
jgi:hypothetical protein